MKSSRHPSSVVGPVRRFFRGEPERDRSGWVYAIRSGQYVKIGRTGEDDPMNRIRDLQTGNPVLYVVLATWRTDDMYALEAAMHSQLAGWRWFREWFEASNKRIFDAYDQVQGGGLAAAWGRLVSAARIRWAATVAAGKRALIAVGAVSTVVWVGPALRFLL